jgi:hypothetical protein
MNSCIANSRFAALIVVTIPSAFTLLAELITNDNYKTQQTDDEDSLTVGQDWY